MAVLDYLLGKPIASQDADEQKIGAAAGVAVLGLDGLSSAAYGPEAALTLLLPLGVLGLAYIGPITLVILALLAILYLSYRQTIAAYPGGGGSYTVARENLGANAGLVAAAALLLDYILNVAVGISAGVGALVSAIPGLHAYTLPLCLLILALLTLINLRGTRESGVALGIPTALFVGTLLVILVLGIIQTVQAGGHPTPVVTLPALPAAVAPVSLWLLLRAFASGCTAMTGVEAVSNGVNAFVAPAVRNAQRTLTAIVVLLGLLLGSIAFLCRAYGIGATDPSSPAYQSVLSLLTAAVVGRGVFYYITLGSVLAVLSLSANTSFAGFPRLCRLIAEDDYLPHAFANRGRRLVYTIGISILVVFAGLLLIVFGGVTDRLIPLFAIGAFLAFTLSQAGMVAHWKRTGNKGRIASGAINALGCVATGIALIIILVAKFVEGAWITVLVLPAFVLLFLRVRRHYEEVTRELACAGPLSLQGVDRPAPPIVIVLLKSWNRVTERALHVGMGLSPDVIAIHIAAEEGEAEALQELWQHAVVGPAREAALSEPQLQIIPSPYRRLFTPLLDRIDSLRREYPDRTIAVVVPELVEAYWYQYLLHNQRAATLKAALLLRGGHRVTVINVPWYLSDRCE